MFGINTFGQSSHPIFGQTDNVSSNPLAPKPFGCTSPFGNQTGGYIFDGMSIGVFGAQSSSPLGSTSVFGAPSPAFGNSTPTFGASTGSAFGNSSHVFAGSSAFGQSPTFGGFGSNITQYSPLGSSFQHSQPGLGSNAFGSLTPFGSPSQLSFGTSSSPAFGAPSQPSFGVSSSPALGASPTTAFCASDPSFNFGSTPAFGQSTSAFGSRPFGVTSSFGAQNTSFGAQATNPPFSSSGFAQSAFGGQRGGSRVSPYSATPETDGTTASQPPGKLESILAMPVYKDKSHEELRWEDYQLGDKGGPAPAFGQSANYFASSNPFSQNSPGFISPVGATFTSAFNSSPFGTSNTSNPFGRQQGGSRISPYYATPTPETDRKTGSELKLDSISAMSIYKGKSHEELRWEDYQSGDKGGSAPFGQVTVAAGFGTSGFRTTTTPTFAQSFENPFSQTTPGFSSPFAFGYSPFETLNTSNPFGGQRGGSRVSPYSATPDTDGATGSQPPGKLESISAMLVHKDKSHEELRWEDYQLGDKGPAPTGFGTLGFGTTATPAFTQSANPFSSINPFAQRTPEVRRKLRRFKSKALCGNQPTLVELTDSIAISFGTRSISGPTSTQGSSSAFNKAAPAQSSSPFGQTSSTFGQIVSASGQTTSTTPIIAQSSSPFGQTSSTFGQIASASEQTMSTTPIIAQSSSPFGQTSSTFGQIASASEQTMSSVTMPFRSAQPTPSFGEDQSSSPFGQTSSTFGQIASASGQTTSSLTTPFQSAQPAWNSGGFNLSNFGQSQPAGTGGFGGTPSISSNGASGQTFSWNMTRYGRISVEAKQENRRWIENARADVEILESISYRSGNRRV